MEFQEMCKDGSSFDSRRYVKIDGVCYSVTPKAKDLKVYWGPYHTVAEAQAVKNALNLAEFATGNGHVDNYEINFEERVW